MGSKSALGHQNDIEKGEKRAEGVLGASWERFGATREAHWGPRTAFGRARAAFRRPKGQKVDSVRLSSTWPAAEAGPLEVFDFESDRHLHLFNTLCSPAKAGGGGYLKASPLPPAPKSTGSRFSGETVKIS